MRHKKGKITTFILVIIIVVIALLFLLIKSNVFNNSKAKIGLKNLQNETCISLDKSDFLSGLIDEDINIINDSSYLYAKDLYLIDNSSYRVNIANTNLRIIINEYSEDDIFIKSTDLGNHDIFSLNEETNKLSICLYEYSNGQVKENTKEELEECTNSSITLEKIDNLNDISNDEPYLSTTISSGSLSNYSNYRVGYYLSWGGSYDSSSGSYCTRDFYKVDPNKEYCVNINDYRISISICEYDSNGKWLSYAGEFSNLTSYKAKDKNCAYISVIVRSKDWGTDALDLLKEGLVIDFSDSFKFEKLEYTNYEEFDFSNYDNYESGSFYKGDIAIDSNSLRTSKYIYIDNTVKYQVNLSNHYLYMQISEFDSEGNYLQNTKLTNGEFFTPLESTCSVAICVACENDVSATFYQEAFKEGLSLELSIFNKYEHNTSMSDLTASDFIEIMNVGWNLGNSLDAHYGDRSTSANLGQETTWGNLYISKDLIDYVKDSGFNTIRIPVTWYYNTYVDSDGNLKIYEEWLERVQTVVDYAIEDGLYVILDTHHEQELIYAGVSEEEMANVYSNAAMLWSEIANYFKDYDEHLIFESYNEVDNLELSWNYSSKAADQVNKLNQIFVDSVRATGGNNASRLLMIPTLLDGSETSYLDSFVTPTDTATDRLILTVHNYSTIYTNEIENFFETLQGYSDKYQLPIIIGEFGSSEKTFKPVEYRAIHAANYVACAKAHNIKCIYWDNGSMNDYGIINRKDFYSSRTDIINALINPVAYEASNNLNLTSMDSFVYMRLNQSSGELVEDKYWGTIVTGSQDKGIELDSAYNYISISLISYDEYETTKIHYVHFYDADMNLIEANNSNYGYKNNSFEIPEGAKYIRIGINDSYQAIKENAYEDALNEGKIKLSISFINTDSENSIKALY